MNDKISSRPALQRTRDAASKPPYLLEKYKGRIATLFSIYIFLFLAWPKYFSLNLSILSLSPYSITALISLIIGCGILAKIIPNGFPTLNRYGYMIVGLFLLEWAARYFSNLFGLNPAGSSYLTTRDFVWIASSFLIACALGGGEERVAKNFRLISICSIIISAFAIIEFISQTYVASVIIGLFPTGISDDFAAMLTSDKTRNGAFRAQSLFNHPLVLGEALSCFLVLNIAAFNGATRSRRVPFLIAAILCVVALPMTGTRSSIVATVVAVLVYIGLSIASAKTLWIRVFGTLAILAAAIPLAYALLPVVDELQAGRNQAENKSSVARIEMWSRGWPAIQERPLVGYGDGEALKIAGIRVGRGLTVDDFYLTQLLDFGILHSLILALFVAACATSSLLSPINANNRRYAVALAATLIAVAVGQKASSTPEGTGLLYLFCGLLVGLCREAQKSDTSSNRGVRR